MDTGSNWDKKKFFYLKIKAKSLFLDVLTLNKNFKSNNFIYIYIKEKDVDVNLTFILFLVKYASNNYPYRVNDSSRSRRLGEKNSIDESHCFRYRIHRMVRSPVRFFGASQRYRPRVDACVLLNDVN